MGARGAAGDREGAAGVRRGARARVPPDRRELDEAMAVGDTYGVRVVGRLVRGRSASVEIVREAERRGAEIIVLGSPRKDLTRRRGVFGSTVDRVMRRAPCRVMVTASRQRSAA
jgi:nucleotide-binding universal stress UspA family protein